MTGRRRSYMMLVLLFVAISFTVIIYNVGASKGIPASSGDHKIPLPTEEVIGNDISEPPINMNETSFKVTEAFSVGISDLGNNIPEGSIIYYNKWHWR